VTNGDSDTSSFVVPCLFRAVEWVYSYCLLQLLRRKWPALCRDDSTELYVLGHFALSFVAYVLSFCVFRTIGALFVLYSMWRIIELVAFYLKQMIGHQPKVASPERSFVLALVSYFEVTLWFAVWYSVFAKFGYLTIKQLPVGWAIFRESLAMMLVNSSDAFESPSRLVWTAMCFQYVVGLFLTLVVIARTVNSLPELRQSRDDR
jgi:hypothetical protein